MEGVEALIIGFLAMVGACSVAAGDSTLFAGVDEIAGVGLAVGGAVAAGKDTDTAAAVAPAVAVGAAIFLEVATASLVSFFFQPLPWQKHQLCTIA